MVRCRLHNNFNHGGGEETEKMKVGSLQMYNPNMGNCEDIGTSDLPVYDLHKISQLDIRLSNTDRNLGNILRSPEGRLLPIDHGYCLPNKYGDVTFDWLYWGQATLPYGSDIVEYINSLDAEIDIQLLKRYGWNIPHGCARTLRISTMLLKKEAKRGLSPFDLGSILSRKGCNTPSLIEKIIQEAEVASEASFLKTVSSIMDRHLASSFGDLQPWKGEPGEEKLGGINHSAMEASLEAELCETRLTLVKETDQSKAKDLQIADLNMELKHEREIKRQVEVQIKAKDLEIAMLTQERVKKRKQDWWLWGTVATVLTIGAASLAYSNPSGSTYQVDD